MSKLLSKITVCFLCFILLIPIVTIHANATEKVSIRKQIKSDTKENKINNKKVTEIKEKRTENTKVFDNGDGTFTKKIYVDPIHSKDGGKWNNISTNLTTASKAIPKEGTKSVVEAENTKLDSNFYSITQEGEYASFLKGSDFLTYALVDAKGNDEKATSFNKSSIETKDNQVLHKEVYPDIDLRNLTFNENVKEDLVLHSYKGYNTFTFRIKTSLVPSVNSEDGNITFKDTKGSIAFVVPKPFMYDSNVNDHSGDAEESNKVTYDLKEETAGSYLLTMKADEQWLKSSDRVYPVYIDPTTSVQTSSDAYVSSQYASTNYGTASKKWDSGQNEYALKVGYYDGTTGTNYAYLKQDISSLKGAVIDSATFNAYVTHAYYADSPNGLWLDEVSSDWSPSTLTWNNKPSSTNIAKTDVGRDKWAQFSVTNTVQSWLSGSKSNYGFKLHTNGNGQTFWKKVVSGDNATNVPYLSVTYHYDALSAPTVKAYSSGSNQGYFNISWDPVPEATGYKVAIYNGYEYEYINVGNVTNWTTKGQKIWPTSGEIAAGRYKLHLDKAGAELPVDPSAVYSNAYKAGSSTNYSTRHQYWVRIVATYPKGDSPKSQEVTPYIPLSQPATPTGIAYSNIPNSSDGYVDLNWKSVVGATGYKVLVFNGKSYEEFDVGNSTNWTTRGKKIWPTSSEIANGQYSLHHDENGSELALDPSSVYKNSGGKYISNKNYWFRIKAYSNQGYPNSANSEAYMPSIPLKTFTNIDVKKEKDSIGLSWNPVPSATKYSIIYKDLDDVTQEIYSGDTPSFTHKGLAQGTIYSYKIKAYDKDSNLLDIAKIDTMTKFDDGIDKLNFDTVITSSNVSFKWQPLRSVNEYEIYKDGELLTTTSDTEFIDNDISIGNNYEYEIYSKEDLSSGEDSNNIDLDTSNDSNLDFESTEAIEEDTDIPEEMEDTGSESIEDSTPDNEDEFSINIPVDTSLQEQMTLMAARSSGPSSTTIRHRTFIPQSVLSLGGVYYFKGDNRKSGRYASFSPTSGTNRTRFDITIKWTNTSKTYGTGWTVSKAVGTSHRLKKVNGKYVPYSHRTASANGMKASVTTHDKVWAVAEIRHSVGLPYFFNTPPNIDYKFTEYIYRNGLTVIRGSHDQFPAYEIYRRNDSGSWKNLYKFDPIKAGTNPNYLTGYAGKRINISKR
ncbi:DNRLRE domain-containing protein [Priestia aryabhattai]|uniref:DNRLRE domain-containing protein n=1 Tax=Priestia aryabhattai TaxID=412384 RepID=UPI001FB3E311|nr:DNRLRE domain-containing protein [Priestia aryabhattai]